MKNFKYWIIRSYYKLFKPHLVWKVSFRELGIFKPGDVVSLPDGSKWRHVGKDNFTLILL